MRRFGIIGVMLLTLIVTKSGTAQQNLIVNGGFDVPDIITDLPPGFQTFNESPAGFGWTIVSDGTPNQFATTGFLGVDLIDRLWSGIGGTSNSDGFDQSVDIDGESSISQTFSTVIGREYTLEFFILVVDLDTSQHKEIVHSFQIPLICRSWFGYHSHTSVRRIIQGERWRHLAWHPDVADALDAPPALC